MVHVNKEAGVCSIPSEAAVRLSGQDFERFAVVSHMGETPYSGHYTATVRQGQMAYLCDDPRVLAQPHLCAEAWPNAYIVFLAKVSAPAAIEPAPAENVPAAVEHLAAPQEAEGEQCGQ